MTVLSFHILFTLPGTGKLCFIFRLQPQYMWYMEIKIGNPVPKTVNLFYNVLCFHQYNSGGSHMDQISLALNKDRILSLFNAFHTLTGIKIALFSGSGKEILRKDFHFGPPVLQLSRIRSRPAGLSGGVRRRVRRIHGAAAWKSRKTAAYFYHRGEKRRPVRRL